MKCLLVPLGVLLLVAGSARGDPCSPIQFFGNTWMTTHDSNPESDFVENAIGQKFLDNGVTIYDGTTAIGNHQYWRLEIHVATLNWDAPPGELGEGDCLVSVYDWQGVLMRPVSFPTGVEPCEAPHLIHSKVWHVVSDDASTYEAVANYYFNYRNGFPTVFSAAGPALSHSGVIVLAIGLAGIGCARLMRGARSGSTDRPRLAPTPPTG